MFNIIDTTRKPRPGEVDGKDYHFVTRELMIKEIQAKSFVENAEFSGNMYGTSFKSIQNVLDSQKNVILDIDVQGVIQLKNCDKLPNALYIFVCVPNLEELEKRLVGRGTETPESLRKRLDTAKSEWVWGNTGGNVDHLVINDNLEKAYADLCTAINI